MISNHLPVAVTDIISNELTQLDKNRSYNLPPESRIALYEAIGPSCLPHYRTRRKTLKVRELPNWTKADCVRSQLSLLTARKVLPLWEIACQESEKSFTQVDWEHKSEEVHREEVYLRKREIQPIEEISVYDVPRTYTPVHILDMTELALAGGIQDFSKFAYQANEWWQIYPRPELMEREFFIKWACQEALYETLGWTERWPDAPAQSAVRAWAGVFYGEEFEDRRMMWNKRKLNEFWRWWLTEGVPEAWNLEN